MTARTILCKIASKWTVIVIFLQKMVAAATSCRRVREVSIWLEATAIFKLMATSATAALAMAGVTPAFAQDEEGLWADYFRASCRDEAIDILRDRYPIAKIKR